MAVRLGRVAPVDGLAGLPGVFDRRLVELEEKISGGGCLRRDCAILRVPT